MIRYRDGKIVSTKGERYTQVTKAESEEMKKSIVNNSWQLLKFIFKILFDVRWHLTNFKTNIFSLSFLTRCFAFSIGNWVKKLLLYIFHTTNTYINQYFLFHEKNLFHYFFREISQKFWQTFGLMIALWRLACNTPSCACQPVLAQYHDYYSHHINYQNNYLVFPMTKITPPILLIIIITNLLNHFIHVRLLFLAVTSYTIVSNSILIILMLILFKRMSAPPWSLSSWHHLSAMKMTKNCNKMDVRFVELISHPNQRLKSKFFEKFSLLLQGFFCCLVIVMNFFQKTLISAFETIISDSTNKSLNCIFFEILKKHSAWCWHSACSFRVYFFIDVTANIINFELLLVVLGCFILCQIGLKKKKKKYQKLKKIFEFYLTVLLNYPRPLKYYYSYYVLYHKNNENNFSKKINRDYDDQHYQRNSMIMLCCFFSIVKYDHSCSSNHVQNNTNQNIRINKTKNNT